MSRPNIGLGLVLGGLSRLAPSLNFVRKAFSEQGVAIPALTFGLIRVAQRHAVSPRPSVNLGRCAGALVIAQAVPPRDASPCNGTFNTNETPRRDARTRVHVAKR